MNHQQQARQAFQQGDPQTAVHHFELWIKENPHDAAARHDLAASWFKVGDFPAAEKAIKEALVIDAGFAQGWSLLASIQVRKATLEPHYSPCCMQLALHPKTTGIVPDWA